MNSVESELEIHLLSKGFFVKRINYKNKFDIPKTIFKIVLFLLRQKPHIVHTHLFDANIAGLMSAWLCRIKIRIYTRHHSNYHYDYFPKAVKYDKLCNYLSTHIIAITNVVKEILEKKENVPSGKIRLIHHGFKINCFNDVPEKDIQLLKQKYETSSFYPIVGVISRYIELKGIQYIIPAFKKILKDFPNAKLILANAQGDYQLEIKKLLKEIPAKNYTEIEFENNLFALYQLFDVFVHVPIDKDSEAFGQIYIEALASSIPSVFTRSGIANDFILDKHNALVVDYKNSDEIFNAIKLILTDEKLKLNIVKNGRNDVKQLFPISRMISELEALYLYN